MPSDSAGHVVAALTAELADVGITEQDIAQQGLRITTTLDPHQQQAAIDGAHATLARQPVNLRTAAVAIDPGTGGIVAYYGGDDGLGLDYTRVERLPGSTFKPFVLLAALQQNPPIGLGTTLPGEPVPGLRNDDGADCARCDLKQAMTLSNNVIFHSLAVQVGPQKVAEAARSAGIASPLTDPTDGIALGNKEVTVLDLASAYATIADGGVWHQPHLVSSVATADGRVLYRAPTDGERRFPERVARNVTEAMLDVAPHDGLALPDGRQVAAKTGTVQSRFPGQNNDAWMAGFTPGVASAVWMGTDMNSPIRTASGTPIEGKMLPGRIWHAVMTGAEQDDHVADFAPYHPIGAPPSDLPPGQLPQPRDRDHRPDADATAMPTPGGDVRRDGHAPPPGITAADPGSGTDPSTGSAGPPATDAAGPPAVGGGTGSAPTRAPATTAPPPNVLPSVCTTAHPCG